MKKQKVEKQKIESRKEENEDEDEDENEDDDYDYENEDENENEDHDDDETMSQNKKNEIIKGKNDILDEIIDKSKSFEEQIKSIKKLEGLKGYLSRNSFGDKQLKFKYFKIELADM